MDKNLDTTTFAVSLIIKAVVIAARFSGIVLKRSLKRLAAMEVDAKDKEIIFLRDMWSATIILTFRWQLKVSDISRRQ